MVLTGLKISAQKSPTVWIDKTAVYIFSDFFQTSDSKYDFNLFSDPMKLIFECLWEPGKALKKADLIILAGVSADFRLNYGRRWIEEK